MSWRRVVGRHRLLVLAPGEGERRHPQHRPLRVRHGEAEAVNLRGLILGLIRATRGALNRGRASGAIDSRFPASELRSIDNVCPATQGGSVN
jgi:hypothetical protein